LKVIGTVFLNKVFSVWEKTRDPNQSNPVVEIIRPQEAIVAAMHQCRLGTLDLFKGIDYATFCHQAHPDFSPARDGI